MLHELIADLAEAIKINEKNKILTHMRELREMLTMCFIWDEYDELHPLLLTMLVHKDSDIYADTKDFFINHVPLAVIVNHGGYIPLSILEDISKKAGYQFYSKDCIMYVRHHYPEEVKNFMAKNIEFFAAHDIAYMMPELFGIIQENENLLNKDNIILFFRQNVNFGIIFLEKEEISLDSKKQILRIMKDRLSVAIYEHHFKKLCGRKPKKIVKKRKAEKYVNEEEFVALFIGSVLSDIDNAASEDYIVWKKEILENKVGIACFLEPDSMQNLTQWRQLKTIPYFSSEEFHDTSAVSLNVCQQIADALGFNISCEMLINHIFHTFDMHMMLTLEDSFF